MLAGQRALDTEEEYKVRSESLQESEAGRQGFSIGESPTILFLSGKTVRRGIRNYIRPASFRLDGVFPAR